MSLKLKILGGLILILAVTLASSLKGIFGSYAIKDLAVEVKTTTFPVLEKASQLTNLLKTTKEHILFAFEEPDELAVPQIEDVQVEFFKKLEEIRIMTVVSLKNEYKEEISKLDNNTQTFSRYFFGLDSLKITSLNNISEKMKMDLDDVLILKNLMIKILQKEHDTPKFKELDVLDSIRKVYDEYTGLAIKVTLQMIESGTDAIPSAIMEKNHALQINTYLDKYREYKLRLFTEALTQINQQSDIFRINYFIASIILLLVIIVINLVVEQIFKSLNQLLHSTKDLARGNYEKQVKVTRKDELGKFQETFEEMRQSLSKKN